MAEKPQSQSATDLDPPPSFESALDRLEKIIQQMEHEHLPLRDLLSRYEEGVHLIRGCQEELETAEKRIAILSDGPDGQPQLSPFDPDSISDAISPRSGKSGADALEKKDAAAAEESDDDDDVALF